jgi:hypothetical protein
MAIFRYEAGQTGKANATGRPPGARLLTIHGGWRVLAGRALGSVKRFA